MLIATRLLINYLLVTCFICLKFRMTVFLAEMKNETGLPEFLGAVECNGAQRRSANVLLMLGINRLNSIDYQTLSY